MSNLKIEVIKALKNIVGPNHVLVDPEDIYVYSFEKFFGVKGITPCVIVKTSSIKEEVRVRELCKIYGLTVFSRGEKIDDTHIKHMRGNGIIILDNSPPPKPIKSVREKVIKRAARNWISFLRTIIHDSLVYKCAGCNVCTGYCPISQTVYDNMETWSSKGRYLISRAVLNDELELSKKILDILYSCATCGNCFRNCSLYLNNLFETFIKAKSKILSKGMLPTTIKDALEKTIKYSNPWGLSPLKRSEWLKNLNCKGKVSILENGGSVDVLLYVGCAASYDTRAQEIAKSLVRILTEGLSLNVGILGSREKCCGHHQRRMGEEGLFETIVNENDKILSSIDYDVLITLCPHCYSTLKNEYQIFGVNVNPITHYTEFLEKELGKIHYVSSFSEKMRVAYFDPCYLSRHNNISEPPRRLLKSLPNFEFVDINNDSNCCGGGGGRMWFQDPFKGTAPTQPILENALIAKSSILAVACPFCLINFEDSIKNMGYEDRLMIKDISELIYASMAKI